MGVKFKVFYSGQAQWACWLIPNSPWVESCLALDLMLLASSLIDELSRLVMNRVKRISTFHCSCGLSLLETELEKSDVLWLFSDNLSEPFLAKKSFTIPQPSAHLIRPTQGLTVLSFWSTSPLPYHQICCCSWVDKLSESPKPPSLLNFLPRVIEC